MNTLTPAAQHYAWRELARRAGFSLDESGRARLDGLSLPLYYAHPAAVSDPGPALVIVPVDSQEVERVLRLPPASLDWLDVAGGERLPVLFWGADRRGRPLVEPRPAGGWIVNADLLAMTFFMLARWEERLSTAPLDRHGRFLSTSSLAGRQGFLELPLVDHYALLLRAWLQALNPTWQPAKPTFRVHLSHDVDWVWYYHPLLTSLPRVVFRALYRFRSPSLLLRDLRDSFGGYERDPYYRGVFRLLEAEEACRLPSTYYFMAARPSAYDAGYDPNNPLVRRALHAIHQTGRELGLHPGYTSYLQPERVAAEKARLEAALQAPVTEVRQHFLRMSLPQTWRIQEQLGFKRDSSMSFADAVGFRAGTCHPFHAFDVEQDRELELEVLPLVVMDASLQKYQQLTPVGGREVILRFAEKCRAVEGVFTLLWHNTSMGYHWQAWGEMYFDLLPYLARFQEG